MLGLGLLAAIAPAAAAQGPPGPPPGNGTALPAPPGTAAPFVPPGTPAAIPAGPTGPGLLDAGRVSLNRARRTFAVRLACQGDGAVRVVALRLTAATLARGRYRCASGRATARLKVSHRNAGRLAHRRTVPATAVVSQAGRTSKVYFSLTAGHAAPRAPGFWTDGHLQCGSPAYLAEPDFTAASTIPISTRGWIAWYSPAGGWHWLGAAGEDSARWDTWTATPRGIAQFHPGGATIPTPWTLGPVAIPSGQGIRTVGVFEIVYWVGGRPDYQWQYVNAGTTGAVAAGGGTLACGYP